MNILIVTRSFPPKQGARSIQSWKVANSLVHCGHRVAVITQFPSDGNELLGESYILPKNTNLRVFYAPGSQYRGYKKKLYGRIKMRIYRELETINIYTKWVKGATDLSASVIKYMNPEVVLTISSPLESHFVGLRIKGSTNLPWVAFFSDPPIEPQDHARRLKIKILNKIRLLFYKKIIHMCDAVATPTIYQTKYMIDTYGIDFGIKAHELPHIGELPSESESVLTNKIIHIGTINRSQVSDNLFKALSRFNKDFPNKLEQLLLVGHVCDEFLEKVQKYDLGEIVHYMGVVSHEMSKNIASTAKALLLIDSEKEETAILRCKFGDYAMTKRPILAITNKGAVRDYLEKYGGGIATTHCEKEIYDALIVLIIKNESPSNKDKLVSKKLAKQFSDKVIAAKYIKIFEDVSKIASK